MDVYRGPIEWTWAEAATAVVAPTSGLVTTIAIVGAIVLVIAVALIAVWFMADEVDITQRPATVRVIMGNGDAANEQSQEDDGPSDG